MNIKSTLIGKEFGNLKVMSLNTSPNNKSYSYKTRYYNCYCNLCKKTVVLPSQNVRNYKDCGKHRTTKLMKMLPYKDGHITLEKLSKLAKMNRQYVGRLVNKGYSAEAIIKKEVESMTRSKLKESAKKLKDLGITRQAMSQRLKNGWVLKKVDGKYSMEKEGVRIK